MFGTGPTGTDDILVNYFFPLARALEEALNFPTFGKDGGGEGAWRFLLWTVIKAISCP